MSTPYRQIRALYDEDTITVYQAYSKEIGEAAVKHQQLSASPSFSYDRTTWIKPSWCWMMYRSGYSHKDPRQACILAIRMKHAHFEQLLSEAIVLGGQSLSDEERKMGVRVQWDPERSPKIGMLSYRSIQIGITRSLNKKWTEEWIHSIEDVTDKAIALHDMIEREKDVSKEKLTELNLLPVEQVYDLPLALQKQLKMDATEEESHGSRKGTQ